MSAFKMHDDTEESDDFECVQKWQVSMQARGSSIGGHSASHGAIVAATKRYGRKFEGKPSSGDDQRGLR